MSNSLRDRCLKSTRNITVIHLDYRQLQKTEVIRVYEKGVFDRRLSVQYIQHIPQIISTPDIPSAVC
jgi:hypothetical protein